MQPVIESYNQIILAHVVLLLEPSDNPLNDMQANSIALINKYTQELSQAIQTSAKLSEIEIGRFLRHDLLNLLTPIIGYAEMLSDGWIGKLSPDQATHVEIILYAVHDVLSLIENQKLPLAS